MSDLEAVLILIGIHLLLCTYVARRMYYAPERMNMVNMVWICCLPLVGPVCGLVLIRSLAGNPDLRWMDADEEQSRLKFGAIANADETVPLEEALLINDPVRRRKMMMSILRSDPMNYLDLLLVARFNEDTETAHYAASTIMELQRQLQIALQQQQAEVLRDSANMDKHKAYLQLMDKYCKSGLLEGQLLRRQRLMMAESLEEALKLEEDNELMAMAVQNYLALGEAFEARHKAERMLALWPHEQQSWLEAMRVTVESRNQQELKQLKARMRETPIDWTKSGREQMALWMEEKE